MAISLLKELQELSGVRTVLGGGWVSKGLCGGWVGNKEDCETGAALPKGRPWEQEVVPNCAFMFVDSATS
jgi:hypothetical protein